MKNNKRRTKSNIKTILLIVIGIIVINLIVATNQSYSKVKIEYKTEYASFGDTLWSIAERESKNNEYYKDKDIREIIYDIKKINNLLKSDLVEGQEILIPKM